MSLHVDGLSLRLPRTSGRGHFWAVLDFELDLAQGDAVALVGASASGKSLVGQALLGLAPPGGLLTARAFEVTGIRLDPSGREGWRAVRGRKMGWVPQEARSALDPLRTVGAQFREALRTHRFKEVDRRLLQALSEAGLERPESVARLYPHQLSGGMAQRVMLALALGLEPSIFVADEPTTALDLVVKAEVLGVLRDRVRSGAALVLVTHEIPVARRFCRRVLVMHAGRIVETGPIHTVLDAPRHPYTQAFMNTRSPPPTPPDLEARPSGCAHHPHCPYARARCAREVPPLTRIGDRTWSCHVPLNGHQG